MSRVDDHVLGHALSARRVDVAPTLEMNFIPPIPVALQGVPTSGATAFLTARRAENRKKHGAVHAQPASALLQSIRAALRGGGDGAGVSAPEDITHTYVHASLDEHNAAEEELAWDAAGVVLSLGGVVRRRWEFAPVGETVRWACMGWLDQSSVLAPQHASAAHYTAPTSAPNGGFPSLTDPTDAVRRPAFGPFSSLLQGRPGRPVERPYRVRATFIFLRTTVKIFLASGTEFTVALPFIVRRAWAAFPFGVLIQRVVDPKELAEARATGEEALPSLFSLTTPFGEVTSVGLSLGGIRGRPYVTPMTLVDPEEAHRKTLTPVPATETVVSVTDIFAPEAPEFFAVTIDVETKKLSVWRYAHVKPHDLPEPLFESHPPVPPPSMFPANSAQSVPGTAGSSSSTSSLTALLAGFNSHFASDGDLASNTAKHDVDHPFNREEPVVDYQSMPIPTDIPMKISYWMHRIHTEVLSELE
jgi:anaphase-promoting complex subunit 1